MSFNFMAAVTICSDFGAVPIMRAPPNLTLTSSLLPGCSVVKNLSANSGDSRDVGWIPVLGKSPGVGSSNSL